MADIISTEDFDPTKVNESPQLQVYNALDCCLTWEILQKLRENQGPSSERIYSFEKGLQAPALEMMLRGIRINMEGRGKFLKDLRGKKERIEHVLGTLTKEVWGRPLNPNSPQQLKEFFYGHMGIPEIYRFEKGQRKVSTNAEALEKIQAYFYARPIAKAILTARDINKQISVLTSGIDSDGRIRTSYNIGGTETGRWSSSKNAFGTGTNLQNINDKLREIFVADPGFKFAYIDLEQAESRIVGLLVYALCSDPSYLDACESADLHTTVCRMVWPDLNWTGDLAHDKEKVAEQKFYKWFSYRDMAKRGGHGTNYVGTPRTMARHLKVEEKIMQEFQWKYFSAFPGIPQWHNWTAKQLQLHGEITTPLGRRRCFFGRRRDDSTLREAVAYAPQSTVGDILNLGLWRVWRELGRRIHVLGQLHDAILIQYKEELEDEIIPQAKRLLEIPVSMGGREVIIPAEATVGWNWAKHSEKNPDGLRKWNGTDDRRRTQRPDTPLLDRRLY